MKMNIHFKFLYFLKNLFILFFLFVIFNLLVSVFHSFIRNNNSLFFLTKKPKIPRLVFLY